MANNVSVKLTIGIPSEAVYYLTYTYNGGTKCSPSATLDLDQTGAASLKLPALAWGTTREYANADASAIPGKPDWFRALRPGAQPTGMATLARTTDNLNVVWTAMEGASHAMKFTVDGGNPMMTFAPHIDATITVGLRKVAGGIQFRVDGMHDGFPNYTLQINNKTVYEWDAVKQGEDPSALAGTGDQDIKISWTSL